MPDYLCQACGLRLRNAVLPVRHECVVQPETASGPMPGSELKRLLAKLWINDSGDCGCSAHVDEMNRQGPQWCRDNIATISGWLREAAHKRRLPYIDALGRRLILQAIRNAEAKCRPSRTCQASDSQG